MISILLGIITIVLLLIVLWLHIQNSSEKHQLSWQLCLQESFSENQKQSLLQIAELKSSLQNALSIVNEQQKTGQIEALNQLQKYQQASLQDSRLQLMQFMEQNSKTLNEQIAKLTQDTQQQLQHMTGLVDKRLNTGFEKTSATFTDIIKRLALIDQAQKKITDLSNNVVNLQNILNDKRSRGAFGEIQLNDLVRNVMPEKTFALQHTLSNQKRCDCILFLPEPTGNLVIDAKFPLESYRQLIELTEASPQRKTIEQQFKTDIKQHVHAIAEKYIIPNETADGAMMFIPAEAVFAEIHAHHPDIITLANREKVWLVSPTTMMAVLTTARAVLKDADTRKQVHLIQEHLIHLSKDFQRFQKRMDGLAKHIDMAQENVSQVHISAKKIASRFEKIEKLEIEEHDALPHPDEE